MRGKSNPSIPTTIKVPVKDETIPVVNNNISRSYEHSEQSKEDAEEIVADEVPKAIITNNASIQGEPSTAQWEPSSSTEKIIQG